MREVLSRGAFILQRDLEHFEQNLAEYLDVNYVLGVADGTNALKLSLIAAGVESGDEVIVPSHTYVASAAAIHYVGANPVFVECGSDHLMDVDAIHDAISPKTRCLMPVQLNGRTANMDRIQAISEDTGIPIVEDSAQALGSKFKGKSAGSFGVAGTFSFYPAKVLGCFGDGGAVITNDPEVAERISLLRDHGRNEKGEVITWGTNCRLDNLQAAVLDLKLKSFDDDVARRREIARRYIDGLNQIDALVLPPGPEDDSDHFDVYQNFEIECEQRDELQAFLSAAGIGTIVQFGGKPVHMYPLGFEKTPLPKTEKLYERMLLLPMHTALSDEDIGFVIEKIRSFYAV